MRNLGFDAASGAQSVGGTHLPQNLAGTFSGKSVCSVSSAEPRQWVVDLVGYPSQVNTAFTRCTATVTYGSGGDSGAAIEIVEVDWPQTGTTVAVHGRDIRVEANYTVAQLDLTGARPPANLAAFITPSPASYRPMTATLTTQVVVSGVDQTIPFLVPERARAYRAMPIGLGFVALALGAQQTRNATIATVGGDVLGTQEPTGEGTGVSNWQQPTNRATWHPLHPRAAVVNITTLTSGAEYSVQWLLELG
jgi:hypothetical protein